MSDPSYPAFPILSFLAFVLVLIPFPWHFQAWNSGTCLYMIWAALGCLNLFINSLVWHGNAVDVAPVWCDISSRLTIGLAVALPAASLCINRRLYNIACVQSVAITREQKRRDVIVDLSIALGIPVIQMALQYVVEGHRYNIFEDIGCYPATFNTPLAYPLCFVWPTVIGLVSAVYCLLTLREFMRRRAQFSQFLSTSKSLTVNRYFRLMALATVGLLLTTPISAYGIYLNLSTGTIQPWKGWADAHYQYSAVGQFPSILWRLNYTTVVSLELSRWGAVFYAFLFFGFFGLAEEARRQYRLFYWVIAKRFGIQPPSKPSVYKRPLPKPPMTNTDDTLPVFVLQPTSESSSKHESFGSSRPPSSTTKSDFPLYEPPMLQSYEAELDYSPASPSSDGDDSPPPSDPGRFV